MPVTLCWHCDRALDDASEMLEEGGRPTPGAVSLCLYCGAVAFFGPDLELRPPTEEELDELGKDVDFKKQYMRFVWARQYVMLRQSTMREREDPDR